jgi:hypothetical protein
VAGTGPHDPATAGGQLKVENWLPILIPILTLLLGWGLSQFTEVLKDRRATERERQARETDLQRSTLLELQDALLEASKLASEAQLEEFVATLPELDDRGRREADERIREAHNRFYQASARCRLLLSRVQDEKARATAAFFLAAAGMMAHHNPQTDEADSKRARESYGKTIDLLGKLLRERY